MSTSDVRPPLRGASAMRRTASALGSAILLALISLSIVQFVVPSRLETASGGVAGAIAGFASWHPLAFGLVVFMILAEVSRYWYRRFRGPGVLGSAAAAVPVSRRLIGQLAFAALAAFILRASVAETFSVHGPSMLPTLVPNDTVLVNRMAYGFKIPFSSVRLWQKPPARGDLVVFRATEMADGPQMVVKRIIGIPGDTIAMHQGDVFVNGWMVPACDAGPFVSLLAKHNVGGRLTVESLGDRTYLAVRKPLDTDFPQYLVKPGEIFVLGDNRGISSDSHIWTAATGRGVPISALEGKVTRIAVGAAADGRMDLSRLFRKPADLKVRLPGVDMTDTTKRIDSCLRARPAVLSPPSSRGGRT
ncbi:MAG TPA: signal peptidase I [Polyangia bacterium]|nr:signal peptidase I [Polyangia bacterium]